MYWRLVDEPEPEELILPRQLEHYTYLSQTETGENPQFPACWSPDGNYLLYVEDTIAQTETDILVWSREEGSKPFVKSSFDENQPTFSPDGRWVAYVSDESGRYEVYVRSFPSGQRAIQISVGGGEEPLWAPGGEEIFYWTEDKMITVSVTTTPSFEPEAPVLLFEGAFLRSGGFTGPGYDVTPDGQRFVMVQSVEEEMPVRRIHVVFNWFDELKRLVPGDE
jgi:serine/threonine-protein kinase